MKGVVEAVEQVEKTLECDKIADVQVVEKENERVEQEKEQDIEWLTVNEFAERAGVSKQAVYQRLSKDLAEHCDVVDGRKVIKATALELIGNGQVKEVEQKKSQVEQEFIKHLETEIEYLRDKVASLEKANAEKDERLREQAERFADLAEHGQTLAAMALAKGQETPVLPAAEETPAEKRGFRKWFSRK